MLSDPRRTWAPDCTPQTQSAWKRCQRGCARGGDLEALRAGSAVKPDLNARGLFTQVGNTLNLAIRTTVGTETRPTVTCTLCLQLLWLAACCGLIDISPSDNTAKLGHSKSGARLRPRDRVHRWVGRNLPPHAPSRRGRPYRALWISRPLFTHSPRSLCRISMSTLRRVLSKAASNLFTDTVTQT